MSDELPSPDMSRALDTPENAPLVSEWLLGTSAVLAYHLGKTDTARMIADVTSAEVRLWNTEYDHEGYRIVLVVEPGLYPTYDEEALEGIAVVMRDVMWGSSKSVDELVARPSIPRLGPDWRRQIQTADGPKPSNQGRKVQLEPGHPVEDQLRFTNEWELDVYRVLRERQESLPDDETIGIVPLGGMRVRGWTFEPDLLITYRGYAGVIEIDGPHHKGHAGRDHSRSRLLLNAGVRYVDRLNVEEVNSRAEVEKFVDSFLTRLTR
ncbi:hypothetical protein [Streptomyces sp. NL15-2K]|uniref:hypothetical protein n=1 Tax=Streptomyces sp. NL15-2K TaxID=376149 RepID=UPI000F5790C0|nr:MULTISPECIES: hypothetical protein [Actinomycetes]WKX13277.1 hypothetical protein Q4V64_39440 [Kutzneria buriramensis]GCB45363.1 hypothetical protein SNL152K_2653 [Streptomyces sp. NL15-2K]